MQSTLGLYQSKSTINLIVFFKIYETTSSTRIFKTFLFYIHVIIDDNNMECKLYTA